MRAGTLPLLLVLAFSSPLAWSAEEDEDHSSHHPEGQENISGAERQGEGSVHARMKHIEMLMEQIRSSSDATRRGRLLAEHLNAMRDQMKALRKLSAGMKMVMKKGEPRRDTDEDEEDEHAAHKSGDDGKGGGMKKKMMMEGGGMMGMHKKMEQRVEMLERMLQQLIEHEAEGDAVK